MPEIRNKRQERFARGIVKGLRPEQAYKEAGYSSKGARQSAHRLLTNAHIRERISELNARVERADIAKAEEVQAFWTSVMRGEGNQEVMAKEGLVDVGPSFQDRLRAAESLARAQGQFVDRVEASHALEGFVGIKVNMPK